MKPTNKTYQTSDRFSIGDIVNTIYDNNTHTVGCIENEDEIGLGDMEDCIEITAIKPIQLSKKWTKTLMNSKFIHSVKVNKQSEVMYIEIEINSDKITGKLKLKYVHELQHILRIIEE